MQLNNLIIISSERETAQNLISRMSLLRSSDSVGIYDYTYKPEEFSDFPPDLIVIIHTLDDSAQYLSLINKIRFIDKYKTTPILFVTENDADEIICEVFDYGINDYFILSESDTKFSLKILKCLKDTQILKELERKNNILIEQNILDQETKFYKKEYIKNIFEKEFINILNSSCPAIFMVITPQIKYKNTLPSLFLAAKLKESLRKTDIVGFQDSKKFYTILKNTKKTDVNSVVKKIVEKLGKEYKICCIAVEITQDFEAIENIANQYLSEALINNTSLYFVEQKCDDKAASWLNKPELRETDFKIYKQSFIQKYLRIITPIFYQMQTILQTKLFQTKVEQYVDETESLFILEKDFSKSVIKIKSPGYAKITVDIVHSSPTFKAEEKIIFDLEQLTQNKIEEIIKQVETDFKKMVEEHEQR